MIIDCFYDKKGDVHPHQNNDDYKICSITCKYPETGFFIFVILHKNMVCGSIPKTIFLCNITISRETLICYTVYPLLSDNADVLSLSVPFP